MPVESAIAGPLEVGAQIGLQLPLGGTVSGEVTACSRREIVLDLVDELPAGAVEEGSVVDLFLSLSWGMYKWICIVTAAPSGTKAEVQLLDAPMFIQRRLDPRVGVGIAAEVSTLRAGAKSPSCQAVVADLSHGGLKLEGTRPVRAGDMVEVSLELTATLIALSGRISLIGKVVMAYPSTHGEIGSTDAHVCFIESGQEKQIEAVDHFVAQQLKCRWRG